MAVRDPAAAVLTARSIRKHFGPVVALDDVDITVMPARVHALVGENGAGKSTLAKILAGIYRQDSGQVQIGGRELGRADRSKVKALGVGMVPQELSLVGAMSLVDNYLIGTPGIRADRRQARETLQRITAEVGITIDLDRPTERMGLPQRQLGEIVITLAEGAGIIILDEPTASLGPLDVGSLFRRIRRLADGGTAVLLITHRVDEVQQIADEVTVLAAGRRVHAGPTAELSGRQIAHLMVGELPAPNSRNRVDTGQTRLTVKDLAVTADHGSDLAGVDLQVAAGETVGIAGVAGSGQQTLVEAIVGIRPVRTGTVIVDDIVVTGRPATALAAGLAWIPENRPDGLVGGLTVADNATLLEASSARGTFRRRRRSGVTATAAALCRRFDVRPPRPSAPAATLSGGNQQKLLVGRELTARPGTEESAPQKVSVVIAHGPSQGLDLRAAQAIRGHLAEAAAGGAAVLLLSTDLDELLALTDRILVLVGGRIVDSVPTGQATSADRSVHGRIGRPGGDRWSGRRRMTALRPDLLPSPEQIATLREVAAGRAPADVIVRGGQVLAVHTGEFLPRDVVIVGPHIAAVTDIGAFAADTEIDATGRHVVPTFVDAHFHIEYSMLTPGQLARLSVPRGTTTVLHDPDCMANVAGLPGMDFMKTTSSPLRIFEQVSPTTPGNPLLERGGASIPDSAVAARMTAPESVSLGESNPFDFSAAAAYRYNHALVAGRRITGHTARLGGPGLWSYLAGGVGDDHNAVTTDEVLERVRLGAMLTVMAGSMNDNTDTVFADLPAVTPALNHMCFCADDKHVLDLSTEGHIDHHVRQAIRYGIDPATVYRMASWQPALYYRLDHLIGAITPGRLADLQLVGDLAAATPDLVMVGGAVVARDGHALFDDVDVIPAWTRDTINVSADYPASRLAVAADPVGGAGATAWVQAMEMYDGYFKRAFHVELPVVDGQVVADPDRDILKIAVVDRHHGDGLTGVGFVRGFGLTAGAMLITNNCFNMNLVVLGTNDEDMATAVRVARGAGGGFLVVGDGKVLAAVDLPVGGMMGDGPWEDTRDQLASAHDVLAELGCRIRSPFMILSFVGLGGVPDLGLTELGLIEASSQSFTDLVLSTDEAGRPACRCPSHRYPVHRLADPATAS